ncbi:MAG: universal stress protein [Burkholderiales bacterium]|jgi:nucleotide-binding universal stress UspA family protein|nr:universal stress protein [Burkholderiales bacterium]
MFKHLLLPTDGSPLSDLAIQKAVQLARSVGAKVTGITVMPEYHLVSYAVESLQDTRRQFEVDARRHADEYLSKLSAVATQADVFCDAVAVTGDHPYEQIIATAEQRQCDLIVMASHGRKGIKALLLGSETHKVLTHTRIPVLVLHPEADR